MRATYPCEPVAGGRFVMQDDIKTTLPVGTTGVPATDVFRAIAATCRPRTFEVSITAWDQLSWPAACDSASWGWCGRSQTPAACQPRSRSFPSRGPTPAPAPCRWLGRTDAGAASARRDRSCVSTVSIPYAGRSATCRPLEDFVQPDRADVARRTAREDLLQTVAMGRGGDTRAELLSTLKWVARPGTAGRATARHPKPGTAPPR